MTVINRVLSEDNKKFLKSIVFLALPIILQEFLNSLVNIIDSLMIGRLGANEINGVGFSNELFFLYILFIFGISSGSSMYMGQFWGKKDVKSIHKVMGICFRLSFLISLVFSAIAFFLGDKFISFYSKEPEVIRLGSEYLKVIAITYLITSLTVTFNAALRSIGQTKIPMMTSFIALIVNAILNYIFIFVLGWGVKGAALATAIARVAEVIAQIIIVFKLRLPVAAKLKDYFGAEAAFVKKIAIAIIPVFLNEVVWAVGVTLYNVAYKETGNDAQAAVRIAASIQNLFMVIGIGVGAGSGILIGNTLGLGDREKAISYAKKCLIVAGAISATMGILLINFSPLILSNYNVSDAIKSDAYKIMIVIAVSMVFKTINYTTIVGILRSGGDTNYCLIIDFLSVWLVGVPAAFLGAHVFRFPIYIIVLMVNSEEIFKMVLSLWRFATNKWAKCIV